MVIVFGCNPGPVDCNTGAPPFNTPRPKNANGVPSTVMRRYFRRIDKPARVPIARPATKVTPTVSNGFRWMRRVESFTKSSSSVPTLFRGTLGCFHSINNRVCYCCGHARSLADRSQRCARWPFLPRFVTFESPSFCMNCRLAIGCASEPEPMRIRRLSLAGFGDYAFLVLIALCKFLRV